MAVAGDLEDWYLSVYTLLSFPAHGKISDLARHLVHNEDGFVEELRSEPEMDDQGSTWAYAIEIEIKAAEALVGMFVSAHIELSEFRQELAQLSQEREPPQQ